MQSFVTKLDTVKQTQRPKKTTNRSVFIKLI